ncbi:hypothetical protein Cadr_000014359 [Camelus dromedarius]|uniref:Uncharacterized protein n=1 Tax=Camelus dromedarius TaxID=9838 RepID=A0A5N4DLU4_CAMDR|nr:hypothetical protein Cadr_000014359 [Camelus dromedarius]
MLQLHVALKLTATVNQKTTTQGCLCPCWVWCQAWLQSANVLQKEPKLEPYSLAREPCPEGPDQISLPLLKTDDCAPRSSTMILFSCDPF